MHQLKSAARRRACTQEVAGSNASAASRSAFHARTASAFATVAATVASWCRCKKHHPSTAHTTTRMTTHRTSARAIKSHTARAEQDPEHVFLTHARCYDVVTNS